MDTILDYLESLKQIYTTESYDLFAHNCNNFTNDFSQFLVGREIPGHITNLPKRVLDTPFGQMLKPQIDASMREVTQAPVPAQNVPRQRAGPGESRDRNRSNALASQSANGVARRPGALYGQVVDVTSLRALDKHLEAAVSARTAATIFFTSSTCAPCKLAYPTFDSLAEQYPNALFVKVDINSARDVASRYQVRATPTFMTFSKGVKSDEWSGADPSLLKANVERVMLQTFPPHPHTLLKLPTLQHGSLKPVTYSKIPPLEKLMSKLGAASHGKEVQALRKFAEKRNEDPREATLPDLHSVSKAFGEKVVALPLEARFAAIDLLRCCMVDPRVSGFFAEEAKPQTLLLLVKHVNELGKCPHNLRLVTIHLACNLFTSHLSITELMQKGAPLTAALVSLISSSLLDVSHPTTRASAATLAFNLAASNYRIRREEEHEALAEEQQVELAASLIETMSSEDNEDASKAMLKALAYLVYCSPQESELMDLCKALDAKRVVQERRTKGDTALAKELQSLL